MPAATSVIASLLRHAKGFSSMTSHPNTKRSGNMLVYIIGAIFLMGILVVLLKGSFQEGTGIDPEKNAMRAGQLMRIGSELERAVRYIINNDYSESDIRFAHPTGAAAYSTYGLVSSIPARQVFSPQGGGAVWRNPPAGIQSAAANWVFSGNNAAEQIGSTCATAACSDLMVVLPNVTKDVCIQINRAKGINNPAGNPPIEVDGINLSVLFTGGVFAYSATLNTTGAYTSAQPEGCFEGNGGNTTVGNYYYYRVLLAR